MATAKKKRQDGLIYPSDLDGTGLGEHDGLPVTVAKARITKAGDGLSESLSMAAFHVPVGQQGFIVLKVAAEKHLYERLMEGTGKHKEALDEFSETTVYAVEEAFMIDPDLVADVAQSHHDRLTEHRAEMEKAKREANGEFELPFGDDEDEDDDEEIVGPF